MKTRTNEENENLKSVRCRRCDAEVEHYFTFLTPTDETRNICWRCQMRSEKGFNAKPSFRRRSRRGVIPR